ncbi:putative ER lumen protein-retaining receptor [Paratrimastix pyriformis]|uniref:ER lumen protein-retaining receptor n=1 Tax=Paratrimastix pyriformis TaxID=342808 RepID=A0ABQ8U4Z8_9EUKA|nr:putative ER lumen protein-retaining receptor [Paratrimastix pyriformis]
MMLNLFRVAADGLHLLSVFVLLFKIHHHKSCEGISLKTQILYCIVFTCRYLNLFWDLSSLYLTVYKIVFLSTSYLTVYLMAFKYQGTYRADHDKMHNLWLIVPCAVLALIFNLRFTAWEILWAFSLYLEAVAILPQLMMLIEDEDIENLTSDYIFCLGGYRGLYVLNWVWRFITEPNYRQWRQCIVWVPGIIQTALFGDFFYHFIRCTTIQHPSSPHDVNITIPPPAAPQMAVGTAIPMPLGMPMLPNQEQLAEGAQKMIVATLKDRIVRAALNVVFFPRVSLLFFLIWLIPQVLVFIAEVVIAAVASCPNLTVYLGIDAGVTLLLSGCGFLLRHLLLEALRTNLFNFAIAVLGSTFLANPRFYTAPATNMTMVMTIYYWFTLRSDFGLAVWQQGVAHLGVPLTPQAKKAAAAPMPLPDASVVLGAPIPAGPAPTAEQAAIAAKV